MSSPPYGQWVLPLVVRIERSTPPERTDALEAAATAVLTLLADVPEEWAEPVEHWEAIGIRKVVRRARGSEWRRVLDLPGRLVIVRTAEVLVHPPIPIDAWPRDLARLQVSGTDLTDSRPPPGEPETAAVLWANPHLEISAGKAMAQAGHAAQLAWWGTGDRVRAAWAAAGLGVSVRTAPKDTWDALSMSGLPVVRDAGFTEIAPGSSTFVADAPWLRRGGDVPEV